MAASPDCAAYVDGQRQRERWGRAAASGSRLAAVTVSAGRRSVPAKRSEGKERFVQSAQRKSQAGAAQYAPAIGPAGESEGGQPKGRGQAGAAPPGPPFHVSTSGPWLHGRHLVAGVGKGEVAAPREPFPTAIRPPAPLTPWGAGQMISGLHQIPPPFPSPVLAQPLTCWPLSLGGGSSAAPLHYSEMGGKCAPLAHDRHCNRAPRTPPHAPGGAVKDRYANEPLPALAGVARPPEPPCPVDAAPAAHCPTAAAVGAAVGRFPRPLSASGGTPSPPHPTLPAPSPSPLLSTLPTFSQSPVVQVAPPANRPTSSPPPHPLYWCAETTAADVPDITAQPPRG